MIRRDPVQILLPGLYPVGALLVLAPLADVFAAAWPIRLGEAAWRFGTIGLEFRVILLQVLGFAILLGVSAALGQRALLRGLSFAALACAVALCAGVTRFIIDFRQMHGLLDQSASGFDSSAYRAVLSAVLAVPVLTSLGGRGFVAAGEYAPDSFDGSVQPHPTAARRDPGAFRPKQVIPFPGRRAGQPGGQRRV